MHPTFAPQFEHIVCWLFFLFKFQIGHDGALPGTRTMMFTDPAAGLGVVLLSNGCVGGPNHYQNVVVGAAVDQIVEYLFEAFDIRH